MAFEKSVMEDAISRAAMDPAAWQDVVTAMVAEFPGVRAALLGYDLSMRHSIPDSIAGFDPAFVESYRSYYSITNNPYHGRWESLPVGRIVHSSEILLEEELLRTEYYADWLRPQGDSRNSVGGALIRDPGRIFLLSCQIELKAADRVMGRFMRAMQEATPFMQRSLEINRMLMGLRLDSTLLRFGLEPEDAAVLLLSQQGGILYANAQSERHLAEGTLLHHDGRGRLSFATPRAAACLAAALRGVARLSDLNFRLATAGGQMEVHMMPLTESLLAQLRVPWLVHAPTPALLVVLRLAPRVGAEPDALQSRLGLTAAEAAVAIALANGATIAEIAEARGVSRLTVRDQVKRAMSKAGARRQADLVRCVVELRRAR